MTDLIKEPLEALKARLTGFFGTFTLVWILLHPKVVAVILFDALPQVPDPKFVNPLASQAGAKIDMITQLLANESWYGWFFLLPFLLTFPTILASEGLRYVIFLFNERIRVFKRKEISRNDILVAAYEKFQKDPEEIFGRMARELEVLASKLETAGTTLKSMNIYSTEKIIEAGATATKVSVELTRIADVIKLAFPKKQGSTAELVNVKPPEKPKPKPARKQGLMSFWES
jgi:hypothetical protein